jgi:hypothetical protein
MNTGGDMKPPAQLASPSSGGDDSSDPGQSSFTVGQVTQPLSGNANGSQVADGSTAEATASMSAASLEDPRKGPAVVERENFLMFVKILFKILEDAKEPETRSKAQRIVMECRRRSQQGDPNFIPLMEALERRLRGFVGEAKWRRAHLFLHHYISKKRGAGRRVPLTMRARPTAFVGGK